VHFWSEDKINLILSKLISIKTSLNLKSFIFILSNKNISWTIKLLFFRKKKSFFLNHLYKFKNKWFWRSLIYRIIFKDFTKKKIYNKYMINKWKFLWHIDKLKCFSAFYFQINILTIIFINKKSICRLLYFRENYSIRKNINS
jgi:hypothetical protein